MSIAVSGDNMEAFAENYRGALAYHRRADQFHQTNQRYSLVFNVACIALEQYLLAICCYFNASPLNHNYICLMNAVEALMEFPPELNREIRSLDLIFGLCSLTEYFHGTPGPSDAVKVLDMCKAVRVLINEGEIGAAFAALEGQAS